MTLCPLACWLSQLCLFPTDHSDYFIGNQKNVKYLSKVCLFFQLIHRWAAGEYYPYTPCSELAMAHICLALNSQSIMLSHNTNFKITAKIDKTNGGLSRTNSVHCRLLMYHPMICVWSNNAALWLCSESNCCIPTWLYIKFCNQQFKSLSSIELSMYQLICLWPYLKNNILDSVS